MTRKAQGPLGVTVVAENPETVDGLLAYFGLASISSRGTRTLGDLANIATSTSAVVLFPDEFAFADVAAALDALRRTYPRVQVVLVTREPRRFQPWCAPRDKAVPAVLLPKPSFGWAILDAVRSYEEIGGLRT